MSKRMTMTLLTVALVSGAVGLAAAADPAPAKPGMHGMGEMPMGQGMMGGGMMNMMGMMESCRKMMDGAVPGSATMPHLPPGNEKLEFQMHAEMMQKMGEIAAKYAERIKEAK